MHLALSYAGYNIRQPALCFLLLKMYLGHTQVVVLQLVYG